MMYGSPKGRLIASRCSALAALCVAVQLVSSGRASAQVQPLPSNSTLQDLINLGSTGFTVGDKQFFNFSYSGSPIGTANPAPTASQINVTVAPSSDIGLRFTSAWQSAENMNQDSLISYAVKVLGTGEMIDGIGLDFNGDAPVTGLLTNASVTEAAYTLNPDGTQGAPIAPANTLSTFNQGDSSPNNHNASFLNISPVNGLYLTKDIMVHSTASSYGGGVSTISYVDNTFQQVVVANPEPASLGLLGVGGLMMLRRRRA